MAVLSRRALVGAATAIVASAHRTSHARGLEEGPTKAPSHLVETKVREWIAQKEAQESLVRRWQDLEHRLCEKIRPLGMGLTAAVRSGLPEARAMRMLMRRIRTEDRRLDRAAASIVLMRSSTIEDALAKVQLGLRIQEPLDCEEYSWALMRDGFERLRELI